MKTAIVLAALPLLIAGAAMPAQVESALLAPRPMMQGLRGVPAARAGRVVPALKMTPAMLAEWEIDENAVRADDKLTLKLMLRTNRAALQKKVKAVSTPGSPEFRQYLTNDEIRDIVGRPEADLKKVQNFLTHAGARNIHTSVHNDWITATVNAQLMENLFQCDLALFKHKETGEAKIRATSDYTIPAELDPFVELVSGMHSLPVLRWRALEADQFEVAPLGADVPQDVTPAIITSTYGLADAQATMTKGNVASTQATVQFGSIGNFSPADLEKFYQMYSPVNSGEVVTMLEGATNGAIVSTETQLDVEAMTTTAPWAPTFNYKIATTSDINDAFLDYTETVLAEANPPLVQSISYGSYSYPYDNSTDQALDYEISKMGLRGVTVVLASGDNGVGCDAGGSKFEYDFPSAPSITMIGATYLSSTGEEIGATLSSGGFSEDYWTPEWQQEAVSAYLNNPTVRKPTEWFFPNGRAYPDISAFGQNVIIVKGGKSMQVSGTSCSAPIIGGIFTLINEELKQANLPPLGLVNPWLYAHPEAFTDVTKGNNAYKKCSGFDGAEGWDPVTGLGTPIYSKLRDAAFADMM